MGPKTILEISESSSEEVGKGPKLLQVNSQKLLKPYIKLKTSMFHTMHIEFSRRLCLLYQLIDALRFSDG